MKYLDIKRTEAAEILDEIRQLAAKDALTNPEGLGSKIEAYLERIPGAPRRSLGTTIPKLELCEHEPHTDNCWSCAPRWGWAGVYVRVR